ncbi:E3 ubiquitin-protein ligase CBL-C isoform X1 [Gopherus flavomarginatus]|uniref:E3 ubiquitin-protein ligase CBL-C isoform X1 n=1 Tax=Gopherus flavomarginatus TaxID=286002 RepID=UPI0021CC1479|nr:E3 ubiquitin-protein ligase CBL-C isoform X1 [Gopherus flavomarginatus]
MAAAGGPGARRGPFALSAAARHSLDKALQGLEKLQRLVEQPGLGLRNSPPCLLQLLPQMRQHLLLIRGQPGASLSCLWEAGYFPVFINNLQRKVKQATKLFKGDPAGIFQEGSASRRMLTKLSLIFSHMLGELRALIPNGQDQGHQYQPSQPPAKAFWRGTWGARSLVSWSEFQAGLQRVHPMVPGPMAAALRATMDLTCSDHVSIFEFDIFTRLFQPWPTLLKNWTHLAVTHPGYVAFLTYDEVRARLQTYSNKPGSYVFRLSCTRLGQWAIGYVSQDGSILQTIPQDRPLFQALIEGHKEGFYLYPDGKNVNPDLTELTESTAQSRIEVSPDQAQLYSQMGSTFQLCKICAENDKDVRLQPCGHLLCRDCLNAWQQVQAPTCPFCRREIQGHEEIRIDPVGVQGAGAAPDEDDDHLEDVESVLRELAALRKGILHSPPAWTLRCLVLLFPPGWICSSPGTRTPHPRTSHCPPWATPARTPVTGSGIGHCPPTPGPGGPLPHPSPRGLRSPADGGTAGGVDSTGDTVTSPGLPTRPLQTAPGPTASEGEG